jgi:predicted RNA-binding Zn-ribbon protein involved in translation (DUF1610 family)
VIGKPWDGSSEGVGGVLCPKCFDRRAWKLGISLRWVPQVEHEFNPGVAPMTHENDEMHECQKCGQAIPDDDWTQNEDGDPVCPKCGAVQDISAGDLSDYT